MSEQVFDERGREWFIPSCVTELRVADNEQRQSRNAALRDTTSRDFQLIGYENGGDGLMAVHCSGAYECLGGTVSVDRHDILQDKLPETTVALRGICTATRMYFSDHGFIKPHEVLDA